MGIYVTVEDREGEGAFDVLELARLPRHFHAMQDSLCARFISEEADVSFNRSQNEYLIRELVSLRDKDLKKEERDELEKLLKYCDRVQKKPGHQIKFYGEAGKE